MAALGVNVIHCPAHPAWSTQPLFGSGDTSAQPSSSAFQPVPSDDFMESPVQCPQPPSPTIPSAQTRRGRNVRQPARFQDFLPHDLNAPDEVTQQSPEPDSNDVRLVPRLRLVLRRWRTKKNRFGLFREYPREPPFIPGLKTSSAIQSTSPPHAPSPTSDNQANDMPPAAEERSLMQKLAAAFHPFPNFSTYLFAKWRLKGGNTQLSMGRTNTLITEVFQGEHGIPFVPTDLSVLVMPKSEIFPEVDGWKQTPVDIRVPLGFKAHADNPLEANYTVKGLRHRSIVDAVKRIITTDPNAASFHLYPHKQYHTHPVTGQTERVYGEMYTADAFINAHEQLQASPKEPGCDLERVVVALQFWSDATVLANFGTAKLWPIYMGIANHPLEEATHDVGYIPSIPDEIHDFMNRQRGRPVGSTTMTHCRRELFHGTWRVLLDDEFVQAHDHGFVVRFPDGVERRVYLRVLTYSADYPEKVLIATIRDKGLCPCPRCLVKKKDIGHLGLPEDLRTRNEDLRKNGAQYRSRVSQSRSAIYSQGKGLTSKAVDDLLKEFSEVPTTNAFIERLGPQGLNVFKMLVVDLLHEFEIGEWKTLLAHLLRILTSISETKVSVLDNRFRQVPPFGRDTIRNITSNVSEMKQLAARDYEDILQVAIPCFEGLFPDEHNDDILSLIYVFADWHSLAKMRIHTDSTLDFLETASKSLGIHLRHFATKISPTFNVLETPREAMKRARNAARRQDGLTTSVASSSTRKPVTYGLDRIKLHVLADYASCIREHGATDNYDTRISEARHRQKKQQWKATNFRNFEDGIGNQTVLWENMRIIIRQVNRELSTIPEEDESEEGIAARDPHPDAEPADLLAALSLSFDPMSQPTSANDHDLDDDILPLTTRYGISTLTKHRIRYSDFCTTNQDDPALKEFRLRFNDHILSRLRTDSYAWDELRYPEIEHSQLNIQGNHLHVHKSLQINFTTYDLQRTHDSIKPYLEIDPKTLKITSENSPRCNILLPALESDSEDGPTSFWYAQVLGIFHVMARDRAAPTAEHRRIDVVWVRWLGNDPESPGSFKRKRLPRVGFVPQDPDADIAGEDSLAAFGFIDPADILRAAHLIPAFDHGRRTDLFGANMRSSVQPKDGTGDWQYFYVNQFVDRDMAMRYRGGGIGHVAPSQSITLELELPEDLTFDEPTDDITRDEAANHQTQAGSSDEDDDEEDEALTAEPRILNADDDDLLGDVEEELGSKDVQQPRRDEWDVED
ncbi:hypothetical protein SISSUDRAFT_1128360 [Sistotremastrum suecicum HHB10207 ss-3]|uniref:Uncharacterized protein n=1 Tax=Sistotremastrum suecicum HHB10207 ss-3 TaxID=1314776 RepID=A0A166DX84_9AGAM|nr:hypothetical protein SISSUDRAFT_1128360 [Sistotremastrum suecicum HHB10207 ss-3]